MKRFIVFAIVGMLALCCVPTAFAGGPGVWTRVTPGDLSSLTEVGLARTSNGVLHVAFAVPGTSGTSQVLYKQISPAGSLGIASPIVMGWNLVGNPALLYDPSTDSLRAFVPGLRPNTSPGSGLFTCTAPASGDVWSSAALVSNDGSAYASTTVRAIQGVGGTTLQTWTGTSGVWVHAGLSSLVAPHEYNNCQLSAGSTGYYANLAKDSGDVQTCWVGWYAIAQQPGLWVNRVNGSTGERIGNGYHLLGSSTMYEGKEESSDPGSTVPMVARPNGAGGVYVAAATGYPRTTGVRLWSLKVNASNEPYATRLDVAGGAAEKENVSLAATPDYRLWVLWTQKEGERVAVYARRSNTAATVFGAPVKLLAPSAADACWGLDTSAQQTNVDVLAHLRVAPGSSTWHTQLQPGLSVALSRTTLKPRLKYTMAVTVKDAGVAVKGATVKIGTRTATTGSNGRATLTVGPFAVGTVKVTVKKSGYTTCTTSLRVRH